MKELIYVVEDDESIRELIKYALCGEGYEAVAFECAEDMLEAVRACLPSVILLDIMLPGMDGIKALETIREKHKNVNIKIIMLTAKNSEINKVTGLNSGADDYLTKPFSVLELVARVKAHLRKYAVNVDSDSLCFGGIKLNPRLRSASVDDVAISLTYKEFELLHAFMENVGVIMEREKLLQDIWGFEFMGESRTVDIHIKNLRTKLGAYGDCVISVRGIGYVLKEKKE